ncbi:rhodanese-related sulfurtransferase [Corynebacterium glutamicum MB001]|uniref:Sulfurtransferase n=1 Tax=Corynebacterium glutamicum (strain ATCC 13032 / DSM 20300 / JCM 1318 / BCRC 11384 / CCUG 27702 / LMG 3730 / NBRC 12168 / NCIMB 10025 / NRRL B-2784 / 534) TaxID=196627 RepID=Q8NQL0_CORGL|nr:sulfurtransferase [Corynebacterium glutamicum]AGT05391.1 rhodanese-related sulfurtransferase [Corynebacterium glutamicum MB001]ARV64432.1 sulfurtransferase [Corynebacterium glutamicum]ASW14041.1 rhodanese-related sulfurtransferase [Corynebacterium glutamicum]AUI00947.1 sulfurtransferase [Corynebacterium glutamicum]AUI04590.1 sulfurtransferase [Corynebacterium glutamicum]
MTSLKVTSSADATNNNDAHFPEGPVVTVDWLSHNLDRDDVIVLCATMEDDEIARQAGIPGAFLADLEGDFSDPHSELPHTAPPNLVGLLESYGISTDSTVVVYDLHGLMVAPRVWWLLRVAGLSSIGVLDGGLPAWVDAGLPTEPLSLPTSGGRISAEPQPDLLVGASGVERAIARSSKAVIDARNASRFAGVEEEPRPGLRKGSIPGSVNIPFTDISDEHGFVRPAEELKELIFSRTNGAQSLVFSCGSGVTACVDAYAAVIAGYDDVVVYEGSWAEWGNPANQKPIA